MGLQSLKEKLADAFGREQPLERDIVYLLVEAAKYIERSDETSRLLHEPDNLKLHRAQFQLIPFFRNWVAHTVLDNRVPAALDGDFQRILAGGEEGERQLFDKLLEELGRFAAALGAHPRFSKGEFISQLKLVLAEQPVTMRDNTKAGYDSGLNFVKF